MFVDKKAYLLSGLNDRNVIFFFFIYFVVTNVQFAIRILPFLEVGNIERNELFNLESDKYRETFRSNDTLSESSLCDLETFRTNLWLVSRKAQTVLYSDDESVFECKLEAVFSVKKINML